MRCYKLDEEQYLVCGNVWKNIKKHSYYKIIGIATDANNPINFIQRWLEKILKPKSKEVVVYMCVETKRLFCRNKKEFLKKFQSHI